MTVARKLAADQVVDIPLKLIDESPTNPRKTFRGIEELAESIKTTGNRPLQPVMVRSKGGRFELVFGARRYRACKLIETLEIPAIVRELDDKDVIEIQFIENGKREDVPPLEEADGYKVLVDDYQYTAETIASRVGKSLKTVHERLQLTKLCAEGRKALEEERLSLGVAGLIARIPPGEELQKRAVQRLAVRKGEGLNNVAWSADLIQREFMHTLKDTAFELTDAKLVPAAGACSTCPKRTGNQRELFADVKSPDVCTDPKCYRQKQEAFWQLRVVKAEETGQKVLTAAATKKLFPYDHMTEPSHGSAYVGAEENVYVNGVGHKSAKQILGKDAPLPVLARKPNGDVVELQPRALVEKAAQKLQPKRANGSTPSREVSRETLERRKMEIRKATVRAATPLIVDAAEKKPLEDVFRFVAGELLEDAPRDAIDGMGARRELVKLRGRYGVVGYHGALVQLFKGSSIEQLGGLVVELLIAGAASGGMYADSFNDDYRRGAKFAGVNLKKLQEAAKKEKDQAKKKPAKKPAKKTSRKEA